MSANLSALIPEMQPASAELVRVAGAAGLQPRITSTLRTRAEQTRLYRRYQSGLQTLPVAPPGMSAHEYGWAFDMVVTPMDYIADVGRYWQEMGGTCGGVFNDPVHFEYPGFQAALRSVQGNSGEPGSLFYDKALDFATGFIPYVGGVQLALGVLGMFFPDLAESDLYDMLENPVSHLERWAAVQKRWIP